MQNAIAKKTKMAGPFPPVAGVFAGDDALEETVAPDSTEELVVSEPEPVVPATLLVAVLLVDEVALEARA